MFGKTIGMLRMIPKEWYHVEIYTPQNQHDIGKKKKQHLKMYLLLKNGGFSKVMLVFSGWVYLGI